MWFAKLAAVQAKQLNASGLKQNGIAGKLGNNVF
jgi:hypothetical protein